MKNAISDYLFLTFFLQRAKALKQMKEDGNVAFKSSNWKKAHELYTQALLIDPCNKATNAKLYFNRATVAAKVSILQCGKFRIFLTLRFYVKSVLENVTVQEMPFLPFLGCEFC